MSRQTFKERDGQGIAIHVARRLYLKSLPDQTEATLKDMVSWALEYMLLAVDSWRPETGVPLRTWVGNRVQWDIIEHLRKSTRKTRGGKVEHVELVEDSGEDKDGTKLYGEMASTWSERARYSEDKAHAPIDLERALVQLPGRLRTILESLAQGATLQEIGDQMGVTRERVRQLAEVARAQMKELLGAA